MNLLIQFQCLFYSFVYGFFMSGVYHVINRLLYKIPRLIRYVMQMIIGISFGVLYFYGLVKLNDGLLRFYFFIMIFLGYLFYQKYYAYYLLSYLEGFIKILKRIIAPFIFFFHLINAIMLKKIKKVKSKWQRKKDSKQKNL